MNLIELNLNPKKGRLKKIFLQFSIVYIAHFFIQLSALYWGQLSILNGGLFSQHSTNILILLLATVILLTIIALWLHHKIIKDIPFAYYIQSYIVCTLLFFVAFYLTAMVLSPNTHIIPSFTDRGIIFTAPENIVSFNQIFVIFSAVYLSALAIKNKMAKMSVSKLSTQ